MKIKLYGLLSCAHCREAREYLQGQGVEFDYVYLDLLLGDEKSDTMRELRKLNPEVTFPTILMGDKVIVGFKKEQIDETLESKS